MNAPIQKRNPLPAATAIRHMEESMDPSRLKRHEETIHADRRRGLGRAIQVPVQVPSPPSDDGSHIDSADHALQYVDLDVSFANEVQLSPAFDSGSVAHLDYDFGPAVHTQQPRGLVPDYAIDPALDLLQFPMTHDHLTGFPPQPYHSISQEHHEQPQLFDARPARRMRPHDAPTIYPMGNPAAPDLEQLEQSSPETFAITAEDWHYPCLNIGGFTGRDPNLPTTFG
ncbi:hypothetical protein E6O75_ATG03134 [Venturia nashicola]|uniref:Uncharacterized protein n=1 Tax=Venturia nashicola TaxID=86259 RepID=A0A4Z1P6W5_9PEZI|nr:hypothetical protein E6O75_ATG03134 [Venturia nashicola]